MNGSIKVLPAHLKRQAVVYLRQSDPKQVRENRESAMNQRALTERLRELTWKPEQILVVDGDQGIVRHTRDESGHRADDECLDLSPRLHNRNPSAGTPVDPHQRS